MHKLAKFISLVTFSIVAVDFATLIVFAFRYIWFATETIPRERVDIALGTFMGVGLMWVFFSVIAYETGRKRYHHGY